MESKKIYGPIGYYYFEFKNKNFLLFLDIKMQSLN